jgi:hypothetical protein
MGFAMESFKEVPANEEWRFGGKPEIFVVSHRHSDYIIRMKTTENHCLVYELKFAIRAINELLLIHAKKISTNHT